MNDSPASAQSTQKIELDGRTFRISPLRLRDYAELERRYATTKPDPLAVARAHLAELPEALQRRLLELAFDSALQPIAPTVDELRRWLLGCEGMSVALELSLRVEHPEVAPEQCRRKVYEADGADRRELLHALEAATGMRLHEEAEAGNGVGRSARSSASAAGGNDRRQRTSEPDWIGELFGTD